MSVKEKKKSPYSGRQNSRTSWWCSGPSSCTHWFRGLGYCWNWVLFLSPLSHFHLIQLPSPPTPFPSCWVKIGMK